MGKYHGIGGFRIGKVGNERYYLRKSSNVVAIAKPYKAINSQWIKQEEFKAYILSLLNVGVPQVYVLDALPEALFPYALLFIQNNNSTSLYLDKDGERTELHISGGGGGFEPTQPQLAAMNSGITTEKRESYDLSVIGVDDLKTRMLAAETGLGEVESSLETKADKESTYTKTDVNVMLDVKADKLTTYTKTEVDDAIDGLDTKLDRIDVSVDTKLELKLDRRTSTGLGVYCHNGSVQGELSVKTSVASSPSDTSVLTEKAVKTYADSIKTDVNNKLDKRTDDGLWLYSHVGDSQGALHVLPVVEDVATDFDILTAKAVKTYVDSKDPLKWNYVGLLGAASGSTLTIKDDWSELLIICRVQEESSYYNISQVIPKYAFTVGSPTGKQCFFGFYWNDNYTMKTRLGLSGSGDSQIIKNIYPRSDYWTIAGFYIYKR